MKAQFLLPNEEFKVYNSSKLPESTVIQMSNLGRVVVNGRIVKGSLVNGYRCLNLRVNFGSGVVETVSIYVHKAIASMFISSEDSRRVTHLDYDKTNNRVENLEFMSQSDICKRSKPKKARSRTVTNSKLSSEDVVLIKTMLLDRKNKYSAMAKAFNVSMTQIKRIRIGENWSSVSI